MVKNYNGKMVLITGGSSGIGLELAKLLAARGANIYILARRAELLTSAKQEVEATRLSSSQTIGTIQADVSDAGQIAAQLKQFIDTAGVPDILVNAAGITRPVEIVKMELEEFHRLMEVDYFGTVYVTKALLPGMITRRSGTIVNISSMLGFMPAYGYGAYTASKHAVKGFSDVLRMETKPHGILVSVVFPPDTQTPGLEEEIQQRSPVIKAFFESGSSVMSAEAVAKAILKGMDHRHYLILPGFESKLYFFLVSHLSSLVYWIMDIITAQAIRKVNGKS